MATDGTTSARPLCGIASGRLSSGDYARNFRDLHPRFEPHEALIEADRCYFCFDAPCMAACPTGIDIAMFIRRIATGNAAGAAETILKSNILGGMCARACPTETLCEEACVRNMAEGQPVRIGRLQRYAVDYAMEHDLHFFSRATESRKHIAVVGSGPASLACAHALACNGHDVTLFEARDKLGGLNEYGIAVYKTVENFAQREIEYILAIGGIEVKTGTALGRDVDLHTRLLHKPKDPLLPRSSREQTPRKSVIPAQAGIQSFFMVEVDSRLRGNDGVPPRFRGACFGSTGGMMGL